MYYENYDLESIVTLINADKFEQLLIETGYDPLETEFIVQGFREGFSLGYCGETNVQMTAPNLKFCGVGDKVTLWNKVMKEVSLKRYAGPYLNIPFDNCIQSPTGLVPKDQGKDTHLIFHLSYPRARGTSVNANTPDHLCTVKYPDFSEAIKICAAAGKACYIGCSDAKVAFRNLGSRLCDWCYLVMKAESPLDGITYYFIDKCLAFGVSISCSHFQ